VVAGGVLGAAVVAGGGVDDAVTDGVGVLDGAGEPVLDPSEHPVAIRSTAALRQAEVRKRLGMELASWSGT
jgi:hypothetical protein